MIKNERTSKRVAKIAGRILELKMSAFDKIDFENSYGFKWSDIRALAASALTQAANKPKRKCNKYPTRRKIPGTGIPVTAARSFWRVGYSVEQINREYPTLTPKQIRAAVKGIPRDEAWITRRNLEKPRTTKGEHEG